mgnify:CR=1 FL=1
MDKDKKDNKIEEKIVVNPEKNTNVNASPPVNEAVSNPQSTVKEVSSTTDNVGENNGAVVISETSDVRAAKNTVVLASLSNEGVVMQAQSLPEPVDYNKKEEVKVNKKGKKVRIVTPRERITNIILSIFFIAFLGGGGYLVYYLISHNPANFSTKVVTLELGETIPQASSYYINLTNISDLDYTLDLSKVEEKVGSYPYTVRYGKTLKQGTIIIKDTKGPTITPKSNIEVNIGDKITKDMLVAECNDLSNCEYDLKSSVDTSKAGIVTAVILSKDDLGNTSEQEISVNVVDASVKLSCTKGSFADDFSYYENEEILLYFNANNILSRSMRNITRNYYQDSGYQSLKSDSSYTFDDTKKEATKSENVNVPNNLSEYQSIIDYYQSNNYVCK